MSIYYCFRVYYTPVAAAIFGRYYYLRWYRDLTKALFDYRYFNGSAFRIRKYTSEHHISRAEELCDLSEFF